MAKRKQLAFQDLLSIPKNDITYFGAQMKGLLKTSEPNEKSAYGINTH